VLILYARRYAVAMQCTAFGCFVSSNKSVSQKVEDNLKKDMHRVLCLCAESALLTFARAALCCGRARVKFSFVKLQRPPAGSARVKNSVHV